MTTERFKCPECGVGVVADEDGCCAMCGRDCTVVKVSMITAAVAYVTREDGKILVVWNKKYGKWAMPGGRIEEGETPEIAVRRELHEETGGFGLLGPLIFEGAHGEKLDDPTRASWVKVFKVNVTTHVYECEPGCPVTWFTRDEFLKWGIASAFYTKMFKALDALGSHQ